jgi:hypothetical protein
LYFLYVVAPLLAMSVTAGLFVYAIASDGTRTKARSRQLTWIDPGSGFHVEQTRQTYYAVIGSRGGIELSSDTAVFPVRHTPIYQAFRYKSAGNRIGETLVRGERQYLSGELLPPRDQVQYLTMRPRRDSNGLRFEFSPGQESVHSTLPFAIHRLLVCDRSGALWATGDLSAGQSARMQQATPDDLSDLLGSQVIPKRGEVPMLRDNVRSLGGGVGGVQVSQLERTLDRWSVRLPLGHFVGLAEVNAERIGVDGAEIMDSVHVVMGEID